MAAETKGKNIQTTKPYQRVSEATNHHAGKPGIPPARIPEITWRKPKRHNDSPIVTSKQTTTTPRRNESGWKEEWDGQWNKSYSEKELSETDRETALRVRSESAQ